jgi:DNA repair photolyase
MDLTPLNSTDALKALPFRAPRRRPVGTSLSETPKVDEIVSRWRELNTRSRYKSDFDFAPIRDLELRFKEKPMRGGVIKKSALKLVNSHHTCQQCLYALELDTYGRGCTHNCVYCYARAELTVHGYWNNPIPVPVDISELRKLFFTVFETDKKSKWRDIFQNRTPIRIGCMSDSFMWMDTKYKVTQELLKILRFYKYPYVVMTRSDLVARVDYLELLDKDLGQIQMSISSVNDRLNQLLEPGTPSAARRLSALSTLVKEGFWTAVRINPIFPIYPDGYFTDPNFNWDGEVPKFDFTTFEMVDAIADAGVPAIIAGFGRFSAFALNNVQKATAVNLRQFYRREKVLKSIRDFHYSDQEVGFYYREFQKRCLAAAVDFTTCYIGNGERHFWEHQDLWSNKKDCCNVKGRLSSFKTDCRSIKFEDRLNVANNACATPCSTRLHERLGECTSVQPQRPTATSLNVDLSR